MVLYVILSNIVLAILCTSSGHGIGWGSYLAKLTFISAARWKHSRPRQRMQGLVAHLLLFREVWVDVPFVPCLRGTGDPSWDWAVHVILVN